MIKVNNLHKSFGDDHVLKDISAQFEQGITNLVIGQSGSGKSVFLKCLVGLLKPDAGEVCYDDKQYGKLSPPAAKRIEKTNGNGFSRWSFI